METVTSSRENSGADIFLESEFSDQCHAFEW